MTVGQGRQAPIASSLYRLVDANVLMPVMTTERGPQPLFTRVSELVCAVAYTDADEAMRDLPEGYQIFQVQVVQAVAGLPAEAGLLIDPRAEAPILLGPQDRDAVFRAAAPFPIGPQIKLGYPTDPPQDLYDDIATAAAAHERIRRVVAAWYSVADAREKLLLAADADVADPGDADWGAFNREVGSAAAARRFAFPIELVVLDQVPEPHRSWLAGEATEIYRRT